MLYSVNIMLFLYALPFMAAICARSQKLINVINFLLPDTSVFNWKIQLEYIIIVNVSKNHVGLNER